MRKNMRYKIRYPRYRNGSALILAVVLTSLLAIVGVLFVLTSRVDKMATSAISENRELNMAIDAVIAQIKHELALDVPGDPNEEYFDYPWNEDPWLASLEPYYDGRYKWRQMSDIYDNIPDSLLHNQEAGTIPEYQDPTTVGDSSHGLQPYAADADGEGVKDSAWIALPDVTTSKGWPIYAAVRVIDTGGMLNVNTAYKFDPCEILRENIDGSSQMQINLAGLSQRGANGTLDQAARRLQLWRCGTEPNDLSLYEQNVVWRYDEPSGHYTPFDISDELKLRNRYILNYNKITTRIERLWYRAYDGGLSVPRTDPGEFGSDPDYWSFRVDNRSPDPNIYDYRHISTTHNMDQIIAPDGLRMLNVNIADKYVLRDRITTALLRADPAFVGPSAAAAQMAANLVDYHDADETVTAVDDVDGFTYYGFERPCVYISELVHMHVSDLISGKTGTSYAIELHKPYAEDSEPDAFWRLLIDNSVVGVSDINDSIAWSGTSQFHVILFQDPNALLGASVDYNCPNDVDVNECNDPNFQGGFGGWAPGQIVFDVGSIIYLQRLVPETGQYITVDSVGVPGSWLVTGTGTHSFQRDITLHKPIRRLWDESGTFVASQTLGYSNFFEDWSDPNIRIQAHPENVDFVGIGDIGKVFAVDAYWIGPNDLEDDVRINLAYRHYEQIFNYLTVIDPAKYVSEPNETRIKGRININTAPWYVIARLPWMTPEIAQAIAFYRDGPHGPFGSIAQLNEVDEVHAMFSGPMFSMYYYGREDGPYAGDQAGFPDLTAADGAPDDLEERDLVFARISNLITVRSDVFAAYILVRIGTSGPQKRVIAILDRSNVYYDPDAKKTVGKVKVIALHPVPDPR
jgi:hypothetical protein